MICREQPRSRYGPLNLAMLLRLVFSWRIVLIEFSSDLDPQTCLCPPGNGPTVSCLHQPFQNIWSIFDADYRNWACNLLDCIHLIIIFELVTRNLQNSGSWCWRARVQQRSPHFRVHPLPNFRRMLVHVALQSSIEFPTVRQETRSLCAHTHLIQIASSGRSTCS